LWEGDKAGCSRNSGKAGKGGSGDKNGNNGICGKDD
jgi:hypothetical protein